MPVPALLSDALAGLFDEFHYLAPFLVLLLCGLGLPLPEEVALIGSGLLLYEEKVRFVPIILVCSAAILIGDSVPYWLGRRYGAAALDFRWVRRVLHPERFTLLEERFERHGNWAIFTCRFLPGVRIPGYFMAGTLGMAYPRFLLLDALGVAISVPISIYLGKLFGEHVNELQRRMDGFHLILAFVVVALVLSMYVHGRIRRRERLLAERRAAAGPPPASAGGEHPPAGEGAAGDD